MTLHLKHCIITCEMSKLTVIPGGEDPQDDELGLDRVSLSGDFLKVAFDNFVLASNKLDRESFVKMAGALSNEEYDWLKNMFNDASLCGMPLEATHAYLAEEGVIEKNTLIQIFNSEEHIRSIYEFLEVFNFGQDNDDVAVSYLYNRALPFLLTDLKERVKKGLSLTKARKLLENIVCFLAFNFLIRMGTSREDIEKDATLKKAFGSLPTSFKEHLEATIMASSSYDDKEVEDALSRIFDNLQAKLRMDLEGADTRIVDRAVGDKLEKAEAANDQLSGIINDDLERAQFILQSGQYKNEAEKLLKLIITD